MLHNIFIFLSILGIVLITIPTLEDPGEAILYVDKPNTPIILTFVGDIMLDRHIRKNAEKNGYSVILESFTEKLNQSDLVIANLEGPVTRFPSRSIDSIIRSPDNFIFTFASESLALLSTNNIYLVSLGNNHILDFGTDGLMQTKTFLRDNNIHFIGDPHDVANTYQMTLADTSFGFVAYNHFLNPTTTETLESIRTLASSTDFTIVYAHWGEEYATTSDTYQRSLAHQFVEAGADLIIGSHPHVIQEKEIYNRVPIYYSLGNFIFDQYWNEKVRCGAGVTVTLEHAKITTVEEWFVESHKEGVTIPKDCHSFI